MNLSDDCEEVFVGFTVCERNFSPLIEVKKHNAKYHALQGKGLRRLLEERFRWPISFIKKMKSLKLASFFSNFPSKLI